MPSAEGSVVRTSPTPHNEEERQGTDYPNHQAGRTTELFGRSASLSLTIT